MQIEHGFDLGLILEAHIIPPIEHQRGDLGHAQGRRDPACVLLPEEKAKDRIPFYVDEEACIQCDYCMESGCPALIMEGEYPWVRDWECIGCAICAQLCPVDAILRVETPAATPAEEA